MGGMVSPLALLTHPVQPKLPPDALMFWNWEPSILLSLILPAILYIAGVARLWRRAGVGRGVSAWQAAAFAAGILSVFVALASPLDLWSEQLFSAHMIQHLVLILIAGPCLVGCAFPVAALAALPEGWARAFGRAWSRSHRLRRGWAWLDRPFMGWLLFGGILWLWHLPVLYQAALRSELLHALEHLMFLASSMLYWWTLLRSRGGPVLRFGSAVLSLLTTGFHSGVLGALLAFSAHLWYPAYSSSALAWSLTPLEDQQIAGLVMWLPGGIGYTLLATFFFLAWLGALEKQAAV